MEARFYQTGYHPYGVGPESEFQFSGILGYEDGSRVGVLTDGRGFIRDQGDYAPIEAVDVLHVENLEATYRVKVTHLGTPGVRSHAYEMWQDEARARFVGERERGWDQLTDDRMSVLLRDGGRYGHHLFEPI